VVNIIGADDGGDGAEDFFVEGMPGFTSDRTVGRRNTKAQVLPISRVAMAAILSALCRKLSLSTTK
jgi:hypothetical protein